jgi:hypothetical protein
MRPTTLRHPSTKCCSFTKRPFDGDIPATRAPVRTALNSLRTLTAHQICRTSPTTSRPSDSPLPRRIPATPSSVAQSRPHPLSCISRSTFPPPHLHLSAMDCKRCPASAVPSTRQALSDSTIEIRMHRRADFHGLPRCMACPSHDASGREPANEGYAKRRLQFVRFAGYGQGHRQRAVRHGGSRPRCGDKSYIGRRKGLGS